MSPAIQAAATSMDWSTILGFATVVLLALTAWLTGRYVRLNAGLLNEARRQRSPLICIHVAPDQESPGLLFLVIENAGRGAAYQVRIHVEASKASAVSERVKQFGSVEHGITYMPPDQRFSTLVADTYNESDWSAAFELRCTYKDADGETHESWCPLDLRMYDHRTWTRGTDQLKRTADGVEKIAAVLKSRPAS